MTKLSVLYDKDISERVFVLVSEREIQHKINTVLTLSASSQSVYTDDDVTFSGTLTDEDSEPVAYANVLLLKNNRTIATLTTNANGNFTTTVSNLTAGTNYFYAAYYGDDIYDNSSSDTIQVNVTDYNYNLTISASTQSIYVGDYVTVSGTLTNNGNPCSDASVDIYDGAFNIGTVITDENGQYSKVVSNLIVGTHSLKAKYGTTESSTVSVVVNDLIETELSIDVPLVLVYGDDFNITGTLATSTRLGLQGETVKLKVGNTVVDSTTTAVDGGYVFNQTPVQTGNHTFQVIYEGDNVEHYGSCESTVVSRTVGKETTVLSVTSPVNNYTSYDGSITFTGTLTDDDGVVLPNKSILVKHNNTTLTTYTTGNNGAFNGTITGLSSGTYQLEIIYEGDSNYSATSVNRTVTVDTHNYNLALASSSPIIETGDSATVIATLTDNNVAVIGETLSYQIKHGHTTIDTGTDTTDNNGQISISYTGTGVGDVDVIVSFSNIQETYELKDCIAFDSGILNDAHLHNEYWIKQYSSLVANVTANGTSILGGGGGQGYLFNKPSTASSDAYDWNNNICIEFDVYELVGNPYFQIRDASNNNGSYFLSSVGVTGGSHVKIIFTDENTDNFRIIVDGIEKTPKTINNTDLVRMGFVVSTTTGLTFTNFVVYPCTYSLSIASDKDIISSADGESATLTATLKDNGVVVSGETLSYQIKHGSTIIDSGTDTTDNNGQVEISYTGTGVGDVQVIISYGSLVQKTYELEDCIVTQISEWSYTSTGSTIQYQKIIDESLDLPSKFVLDFDYKGTNQARTGLFNSSTNENYNIDVQVTTNDYVGIHRSTSTTGMDSGRLTADNTQYHNCQIIVDGTTVTWILGGTNTSSANVSWITSNPLHYLIVEVWVNGATAYIKNLKVKAL